MRFGSPRLSVRLLVARTVVYCQAAVVVMIAGFALEVVLLSGPGTGFPLSGFFASTTVTGGGVPLLAVVYLAIAVALVAVERRAAVHGGSARSVLTGGEVAFTIYLIGFVANTVGAWIFGPAAGIAVLALHWWPELKAYFLASDATATVHASSQTTPSAAGPRADGSGSTPSISAQPPL